MPGTCFSAGRLLVTSRRGATQASQHRHTGLTIRRDNVTPSKIVKNRKNQKNRDFDFLTGSKWFFDDFEKMTFSAFFHFFSKIFKNRSKVAFLTQTDLGNVIFVKKPSRLIPEKPIFDPR